MSWENYLWSCTQSFGRPNCEVLVFLHAHFLLRHRLRTIWRCCWLGLHSKDCLSRCARLQLNWWAFHVWTLASRLLLRISHRRKLIQGTLSQILIQRTCCTWSSSRSQWPRPWTGTRVPCCLGDAVKKLPKFVADLPQIHLLRIDHQERLRTLLFDYCTPLRRIYWSHGFL